MAKHKTQKEKHPLYHTWAWMRRMSVKASMQESWKEDFYSFVQDVGERPSVQHRLYRKDENLGYSKDNCYWREVLSCADSAERQRIWRSNNQEKSRGYDLKRTYGLSLEDYKHLLEKQNGVCAICQQPETVDRYKNLAVDHCHETGKIRGLLCVNCNKGLGHFKDKKESLKRALEYLSA